MRRETNDEPATGRRDLGEWLAWTVLTGRNLVRQLGAVRLRRRRRHRLRAISQQQGTERIAGAERIELALAGADLVRVEVDHGVALEAGLRHALAARQFVLHYQPVFDQDRRMVGAEALVRWQRPGKGLVGPAEFICHAEKSDLIVEIGHWVLEAACRQLAAWQSDAATRTLTLAVNISARQAGRPDFVGRVMAVLSAAGADPRLLKLELTESMQLADVDDIATKMQLLKEQGIGLALDDFGTGYASLSYLQRLPLTQLKIDRSFVRDMLVTPNGATIVQTIITLARQLQLDVVAEGVETEHQRAALLERGCTGFQGFLFAAPGPVEALRRWHTTASALSEH